MMQRQRPSSGEATDDGHYWISISDLMTSLLFIFIIILAYTVLTLNEKSDQHKKNVSERTALLTAIEVKLANEKIDIQALKKDGIIRLRTDSFFESNSAELSVSGKNTVAIIARVIQEELGKNSYKEAIDTIFIEGHTDNAPTGMVDGNDGNMLLSAKRAINTYATMDKVEHIGEATNHGKSLYSYSGYAATRPIKCDDQSSQDCRAKNRRIEFFFALAQPVDPSEKGKE